MNNNISREFIENKTHGFDPGDRAHWAKPRCGVCQEFAEHPVHNSVIGDIQTLLKVCESYHFEYYEEGAEEAAERLANLFGLQYTKRNIPDPRTPEQVKTWDEYLETK